MFGGKFTRVTLSAQGSGDGQARVTKTLQFSPQPRNKSIYILTDIQGGNEDSRQRDF